MVCGKASSSSHPHHRRPSTSRRWKNLGNDETGNHTGIDNLSINGIVAVIPEPSALALLGLGLMGVIVRRRRC
jgi:hypothetical protein